MEFMSAREAADKWGISQRRVAVLCSENRIDNATMVGNMWIIPTTAEKPIDARSIRYMQNDGKKVKPFLKWAGGKGQLLSAIEKYYPFADGKITKYAEPFVGGGAVLFDILSKYDLDEIYISDINAELINTYRIIRDDIDELISMLSVMQNEFVPMDTEHRKVYYLEMRERFNDLKVNGDETINIEKAALMIFLNKTCFNGLFRVNKKGLFNVPMGSYKNPMICDEDNLRAVSEKLQNVTIICGDYRKSADFIDENTFVYFDPPVLSQIPQVLLHILKTCLTMRSKSSLRNLLMICTRKVQRWLSAILTPRTPTLKIISLKISTPLIKLIVLKLLV